MSMASQKQQYSLSHTGSVLGNSNVTTEQNQANPQQETTVVEWECPREYEAIEFVGQRDATRFVPRTMEQFTGTANDDTVQTLSNDIQPVAGESDLADQDYPVVVAYNVTDSTEIDIDSVDYAANQITLASDPDDGDDVKLYPILAEGTAKFVGVNQFDQVEGPVFKWSVPLYRWHDFEQNKRGTEVNLSGAINWTRNERLRLVVDAPHQIVWEDADYPNGGYVSTIEQDVEIML